MKIKSGKVKTRRNPQSTLKGRIVANSMTIPSIVGVLLFFIIPFGVVIYYSLVDNVITKDFVMLDNYIKIVQNGAFQKAAKNTAIFTGTAVPLAVILSLLLAMLLDSKIPFKSQFRTFFLSPMMVPVASIVLIWQVIFDQNGALNELLRSLGLVSNIDWMKSDYNRYVMILLFLWKNLGYNMILFMAALSNIPNDLLEMATLEGAGEVQKFRFIKLRYISPTILFVTILSIINSFKAFREIYQLTSDYPVEGLYMLQTYMNNMFKSLDYQKLSTAAILMAIVMIILIGIMFLIENKLGKDVEG